VKIPWVNRELSGPQMLVMEWIDGVRCTDLEGIRSSGIDVEEFMRVGVVAALRQLLEFGLFHGDPHPGNLFAMRDGRIAYVDFGNVAQISQRNKQILVDAVIHAVNEDYEEGICMTLSPDFHFLVIRSLLTQEGLDLSDTVKDGAVLIALDDDLREQVLNALTEGNRIHLEEVQEVLQALEGRIDPQKVVESLPQIGRKVVLGWADKILSS